MDVIWGIDISSYQGLPDFDRIKNEKQFVFIKASEGVGFTDPQFQRNKVDSRRVGLGRGFYHFARPDLGNTPEQEADFFVSVVNDLQKNELLALDFELEWAGDKVGWCQAFLRRIKTKYSGYKALLYISLSMANTLDWSRVINDDNGLWVAVWDGNADIPGTPWPNVAIKQYSATGKCAGVVGNVDEDVFFGNLETFKKYGYQPTPPIPPAPTCEQKLIEANKEISTLHAEKAVLQKKLDDIKLIVNS